MAAEKYLAKDRKERRNLPASAYPQQIPIWERDISEEMANCKVSLDNIGAPETLQDPMADLFAPHHQEERSSIEEFEPFDHPKPSNDGFLNVFERAEEKEIEAEENLFVPVEPSAPLAPLETKRDAIEDLLKMSQTHTHSEENILEEDSRGVYEEKAFQDVGQLGEEKLQEQPLFHLQKSPLPPEQPPSLLLDDFDTELEKQLAAINIRTEMPPEEKRSHHLEGGNDDGWGDENDDYDFK